MPSETQTLSTPTEPFDEPTGQRAIHLPTFLNRILPYYTQPAWLEANRWRQFVRNQSIAVISRDTLIQNMLHMEWDIVPREPDNNLTKIKKAVDYYKELFTYAEGDFDIYLELMLQDMLDLPFGAASEVGRLDDEPENPIVWIEHIDAATLYPTGNVEYPVAQQVPDVPGVQVVFPRHAINRMYMSPRPEIRIKGWGMAPPQKIYLAIEMLFRGDHYYWKLLLDTPEAGLLDLGDMSEDAAKKWLDGFRDLFAGIDGFKVPVLYGHDTPAQWLPFNRAPNDLLYDTQYLKYAAITAAGYGLRLSDIGLEEPKGQGTLAGVIRQERQTKRTGRAVVKAKTENHFNWMLPPELKFVWKDRDDEGITARGKAMVSVTDGIGKAKDAGLIDQAEGRAELIASGVFETELDPKKVPEEPKPQLPPGFPGQPGAPDQQAAQAQPEKKPDEEVPVSQGGRGGPTAKSTVEEPLVEKQTEPMENPVVQDMPSILERMDAIIRPGLEGIRTRAADPRLRRLIKAATREMFESVAITIRHLTQEQVEEIWLPQIQAATFDQPNEIESPIVRRGIEEAKNALERHLEDDKWWSMLNALSKTEILELFIEAYENGMGEGALEILRALYDEGFATSPYFSPSISFNLVNEATIGFLERAAAELVRRVDQGTKYFLKRMIVSGVRQGLSSDKIAAAIRDGDAAERILSRDDYIQDVSETIRNGMIEMTEYRAKSIVNTEISRAENAGKLAQFKKSGLKYKGWVHLGKRGTTDLGNEHPCPICAGNEALGFVPIDHLYDTVFKTGGVDGEGRELHPPGHPSVCHCTTQFKEDDLFAQVAQGTYTPWGGD